MNRTPLVSIIVPCYNNDRYLGACVESLLQQSYDRVEILIVNDGSTDASPETARRYSQKDRRVKVISKENGGLPSARNAGLDNATGDYIIFCDADDSLKPHAVQTLLDAAGDDTDFVIGSHTEYWLYEKQHINPKGVIARKDMQRLFRQFIAKSVIVCKNLYRKSIIDAYGLRFDETMNFAEDYYFNIHYLKHIHTEIVICDIPVYNYYTYRSSQHRKYYPDMYLYYARVLDAANDYFEDKEYGEEQQRYFADFYMSTLIEYYTFYADKAEAEEKLLAAFRKAKEYFDEALLQTLFSPAQYNALHDESRHFIDAYYGKRLPYLKLKNSIKKTALSVKRKLVL